MEPLATNLRKRAEALALSHAEIARRAGLTERRYGNYVTGEREPDLATLVRIAKVLGRSIDELLDAGSDGDTVESPVVARIASAVGALDVADQEVIAAQVEALVALRGKRPL